MLCLPKIIGHRGASYYAPENTLASLRKAAELNIPWVEFDVVLTRDGQPIILHDETLDRTTNGQGKVVNTTYSDIQKLDAGNWFSSEFRGEKIPTLAEYLVCADQLGLGINVEIKPTPGAEVATAEATIQALKHHYSFTKEKLLVSSFSLESLETVRKMDANLPIGLLLDEWTSNWQQMVVLLNCLSLNIERTMLLPENIDEVKKWVKYVLVYTVDDVDEAKKLYQWAVDSLFSNRPDIIQKGFVE